MHSIPSTRVTYSKLTPTGNIQGPIMMAGSWGGATINGVGGYIDESNRSRTAVYKVPSGDNLQTWAHFASDLSSTYTFPNGGNITFLGSSVASADIYFKLEYSNHPNQEPSIHVPNTRTPYNEAPITLNAITQQYTIDIPPHPTNTYTQFVVWINTLDVDVTLDNILVNSFHSSSSSYIDNTYLASYTKHDNDVEGEISFNIVFEDLAGNENTYYIGQLNEARLRFDSTAVMLGPVAGLVVSSNNTNTDYAKIGDVITYTVKTNHRIQTPELTFNGAVIPTGNRTRIATGTEWNSADEWTLTHTVSSSDPSGAMNFSLDLFDLAGNKYNVNQSNISGLNVKIQHDRPTITALGSGELKGGYFFDDNSNSYDTAGNLESWDQEFGGATGNDMIEGQLTQAITKKYSVDVHGNWSIIYKLTNSSGLKARKIIRLKNVPGGNKFVWAWRN